MDQLGKDVCVVGTGIAALVAVRARSDAGRDVVVLDGDLRDGQHMKIGVGR